MTLTLKDHHINQVYANYIQPLNQRVFNILESRAQSVGATLEGQRVLDFGCNIGHLLTTSEGRIRPSQYVGIDVNSQALRIAQDKHPSAKWIHYNKYNNTFNPEGVKGLAIPLQEKFDVVIAYGVFTHFFMKDILETTEQLVACLRPKGLLMFSLWEDVDYYGYLGFLDRQLGINVGLPKPKNFENGFVLVNRKEILVDTLEAKSDSYDWIESFYRSRYVLDSIKGSQRTSGLPSKHPVYTFKT